MKFESVKETIIDKIFETDSSLQVKQRTTAKVQCLLITIFF